MGEITGRRADDHAFRTPSLCNVAVTEPWLHDGSATTPAYPLAANQGADAAEAPAPAAFLTALTDRQFLTDPRLGYPDGICKTGK